MERATVERYEQLGLEWAARRQPVRQGDARAFGRLVPEGGIRLDAGAGAGRYTVELGTPVVALDAAHTMLRALTAAAPAAWPVQADLEALPLRGESIDGVWANMSYLHVPRARLPMAFWDLHRVTRPGGPFDIQVLAGDYEGDALPSDDIGGRFFSGSTEQALDDILVGAGFDVVRSIVDGDGGVVRAAGVRARSLADTVGPDMRLLVCGLNPSIYSADRGVGFARPGNRFWGAAMAAGLVDRPRDPRRALLVHGVGMTDLCKRATVASAELSVDEYRAGVARVDRLVRWLRPAAVCFVGLEGWRSAIDAKARAGAQPDGFADRPAYVMPSTSGLNAHSRPADLAAHFRAAAELAGATG